MEDLDAIAPPVAHAVVFFAAPSGALAPDPVVTGPDGTFRQSGFEVGRTYTAEARAAGFVAATGVTLFGTPGADLSRQSVTRSSPGLLEGVALLLAPAS